MYATLLLHFHSYFQRLEVDLDRYIIRWKLYTFVTGLVNPVPNNMNTLLTYFSVIFWKYKTYMILNKYNNDNT